MDEEDPAGAPAPDAAPPPARPAWRSPILPLLAAYALLVIAYGLATPLGEAPDEPSHVQYVMYLREERALPVVQGPGEGGLPQAKHPPLYYLLGHLLALGGDFDDVAFLENPHFRFDLVDADVPNAFVHPPFQRFPFVADERSARRMRLASLLAGLVTVWATWRLGRQAWPEREEIALAAAGGLAFLPGFLFFSAVFNNDALAVTFATLALWLSVRAAQGRARPRDLAGLGAALGLGMLTKLTTIAAWPLAALALAVSAWRGRSPRRLLREGLWVAVPALLLALPWWARNMRLYGPTDPLGTARWAESIPHLARRVPLRDEIGTYLAIQLHSFGGRFGWGSVPLPGWMLALLGLSALGALAGLIALALRRARLAPETRVALVLSAAAAGLYALSVWRLAPQFDLVVAQGRYLYTALPALGLLWAAGLLGPLSRRDGRGAALAPALLLVLGMAGLASAALVLVLVPAFRPPAPAPPDPAALAIDAPPLASGVALRGLRLAPATAPDDPALARVAPGDVLSLTLRWRAPRRLWRDLPTDESGAPAPPALLGYAHLVDARGEVVARAEAPPFGGRFPPAAWTPGEDYAQRIALRVDPGAAEGAARLLVGMYPEGRPEAGGEPLEVGPLVLRAPPSAAFSAKADAEAATLARFGPSGGRDIEAGPRYALVGARLVDQEAGADAALELLWRVETPGAVAGTVFVHLLPVASAPGTPPTATLDGPPGGGADPQALWRAGDVVRDRRSLTPAQAEGLRRGALVALVGWYGPPDGARWPAVDADGSALPEDAYRVAPNAP